MSVAEATRHIEMMVKRESRGWGDQGPALERIARRYGLSRWTLDHLRKGRAKTVSAAIRDRLRAAYLDICERQILALQHELATERAKGGGDAFEDLEHEAAVLVARLVEARGAAALGSGR